MPLTGMYGLLTLGIVLGTFVVLYRKWGWKIALPISLLILLLMSVLFLAFLSFALGAMG